MSTFTRSDRHHDEPHPSTSGPRPRPRPHRHRGAIALSLIGALVGACAEVDQASPDAAARVLDEASAAATAADPAEVTATTAPGDRGGDDPEVDVATGGLSAVDATAPAGAANARRPSLTGFKYIFLLGDSLTDQHNQYSSWSPECPNKHLGYWNGRFTNGYNWVDYLTQDNPDISDNLRNHAVGGSKVLVSAILRPSIMDQANKVISSLPSATRRADLANSLVILWAGPNDLRDTAKGRTRPNASEFGTKVYQGLTAAIDKLAANGASHVLLIGVPYLNWVPDFAPLSQAQRDWVYTAASTVNTQLSTYASSKGYLYATVPAMINDYYFNNKYSVNMTDTTNACATQGACNPTLRTGYVEKLCKKKMFFDTVHPTTGAHCGVAKRIEQTLAVKYDLAGYDQDLESCARRRQAGAFGGVPARPILFDVETALLYPSSVGTVCASECRGVGATWNGQWDNPTILKDHVSTRVGVCGCTK